jgi:2-polyprenyl-3-methyl-5-hydroxy-6-metoxy-1,4-benzoquinol methylase
MLELKPTSEEWKRKFRKLLTDPFLSRKYDRKRRIRDKISYIGENCPSLKNGGFAVLDIGPGPGEFLELCRYYGNKIRGIDAPPDDCEMGENYLKLSRMLCERQKVPVDYSGFHGKTKLKNKSVDFINMQGSIEQCFYDCLTGRAVLL